MSDTSHVQLVRVAELADSPCAYAAVTPAARRLVHTSGVSPLDLDGAVVSPGDPAGQTAQVLDNLAVALAAVGASLTDVVKTTVYVASSRSEDLLAVWRVVSDRFGDHDPPSTLVGVTLLGYPGQLVEVEAVAAVR